MRFKAAMMALAMLGGWACEDEQPAQGACYRCLDGDPWVMECAETIDRTNGSQACVIGNEIFVCRSIAECCQQPQRTALGNERGDLCDEYQGGGGPGILDAGPGLDLSVIPTQDAALPDPDDGVEVDQSVEAPMDAGGPAIDSGLLPPDAGENPGMDGTGFYTPENPPAVDESLCPDEDEVPPGCLDAIENEGANNLCDGFDNDCDGLIDEGCICKPGDVQACFAGPPGRVSTGACRPGTQRCITENGGLVWGDCEGGIGPQAEICDGLDNDCNGCTDEIFQCDPDGACPGPGDPRTPTGRPFEDYRLLGGQFYEGEALAWEWSIEGGPCDDIVPGRRSFDLLGANRENAIFTPRLSGSYTVTLRVTTPDGIFECTWIIDIVGPGVRIEMCYPESLTQDLDLLVMPHRLAGPWYPVFGNSFSPNPNACSWWNCEASLRGAPNRVNWGYGVTGIEGCEGGPQGDQWRRLGSCSNPRLDIDNNLEEGIGLPENINVDNPDDGEELRIIIQNFTGLISRPVVNVYCGGRLMATYGAQPDTVPDFAGLPGAFGIGAIWRVADVEAEVNAAGETVDCTVTPLHPPGQNAGYHVTNQDGTF